MSLQTVKVVFCEGQLSKVEKRSAIEQGSQTCRHSCSLCWRGSRWHCLGRNVVAGARRGHRGHLADGRDDVGRLGGGLCNTVGVSMGTFHKLRRVAVGKAQADAHNTTTAKCYLKYALSPTSVTRFQYCLDEFLLNHSLSCHFNHSTKLN